MLTSLIEKFLVENREVAALSTRSTLDARRWSTLDAGCHSSAFAAATLGTPELASQRPSGCSRADRISSSVAWGARHPDPALQNLTDISTPRYLRKLRGMMLAMAPPPAAPWPMTFETYRRSNAFVTNADTS